MLHNAVECVETMEMQSIVTILAHFASVLPAACTSSLSRAVIKEVISVVVSYLGSHAMTQWLRSTWTVHSLLNAECQQMKWRLSA